MAVLFPKITMTAFIFLGATCILKVYCENITEMVFLHNENQDNQIDPSRLVQESPSKKDDEPKSGDPKGAGPGPAGKCANKKKCLKKGLIKIGAIVGVGLAANYGILPPLNAFLDRLLFSEPENTEEQTAMEFVISRAPTTDTQETAITMKASNEPEENSPFCKWIYYLTSIYVILGIGVAFLICWYRFGHVQGKVRLDSTLANIVLARKNDNSESSVSNTLPTKTKTKS